MRRTCLQSARPLAATLAVAAVLGGCTAKPDAAATLDTRTAVILPADGQLAVLKEMRQMLGAMGGALQAAAREDTTALFAAIAPAGSAAAADPAIEALLPAEWKELAERTHGGFDSLAVAVRRAPKGAALRDTVMLRVSQLTVHCSGCHEMFRVTVRQASR